MTSGPNPRPSPAVLDGAVVAVLLPLNLAVLLQDWSPLVPVAAAGASLPLWWRRRAPVVAFVAVCGAFVLQLSLQTHSTFLAPALLIATYSLGCYADRRAATAPLGLGYAACLLAVAHWSTGRFPLDLLPVAALGAAAWILGDNVRTRRAYTAALEERAVRLERERDVRARMAATEERARIAREMHDVVAHNLAVMVAQADGAAYAIDADPARARDAIETVAATGRSALGEMRRLVGVLRTTGSDGTDAELGPQPGLCDVTDLVQRMRAAGMCIEYHSCVEADRLPEGMSLTVYRVVQESLTNVLKHAGPGAPARVELHGRPGGTAIAVCNGGSPRPEYGAERPAPDGGGNGLAGMRERVALYGGVVTAGPATDGGWRVEAWLPEATPA